MRRTTVLVTLLLAALAVSLFFWLKARDPGPLTAPPLAFQPRPVPGAALFDRPTLLAFRIEFTPAALEALRRDARKDAPATVTVDGQVFTNVAIHLKGAAGSFRGVDDRPALTLSFNKNVPGRKLHGLRKIHLNNSVQDGTYFNEYVASDLFRAANVPTPRVAWATVELNQRKLGLYVLKEGFSEDFLKQFFSRGSGNLYDGGFLRDIDQQLELDTGKGVTNWADLKALAAAAVEPDKAKRWARLQQTLEVDRFASYTALSIMLSDWDGYPLNRNNYRVYFNPANGKAVFLPHGMDQMFQRTDMEIDPWFNGLVARGVFETPEGQRLYEQRFRELYSSVFRLDRMTNAMNRVARVLRPVQPDIDSRLDGLRWSIAARIRNLQRQPLLKEWLARLAAPPTQTRAAPSANPSGPVTQEAAKTQTPGATTLVKPSGPPAPVKLP